jgi:alpha(1,3/1,4) fucosyltransferase
MTDTKSLKIGLTAFFQHSFFSSGLPSVILTLAEVLKRRGHTVILFNTGPKHDWYEDCKELSTQYERVNLDEWKDRPSLDLLIDIDGFLNPSERRRVANKVVVFIRKAPFLHEQESAVYPIQQPIKNIRDCDAVWTWDHFGDQDAHLLELLSQKPVVQLPYCWSPTAVVTHTKEYPPWMAQASAAPSDAPWVCHISETNMSMSANCTLSIVGLAYTKTHHPSVPLRDYFVHNGQTLEQQQFFKENILAHCRRDGLEPHFVGRQRIGDWRLQPKSFLLSHVRFLKRKTYLLDALWNGIPVVHNSPYLCGLGFGLDRLYYADNSVVGIGKAIEQMNADFLARTGFFAPGCVETIRERLQKEFTTAADSKAWSTAVFDSESKVVEQKKELKKQTEPVTKQVLRIGFSDMWQDANCEYNFWILLLREACRHIHPDLTVEGVKITDANITTPIDLLIFAPFGDTWTRVPASVPKIHTTGENSRSKDGPGVVMNFGFDQTDSSKKSYRLPLWVQYIDWFGADQERLINPRTLPIDSLATPSVKVSDRSKFCAFVVSNPTNPVRNQAFQALSSYKQVDSGGRLFNNIGDELFVSNAGGGGGELKKHRFLQKYKFCFAYENSRQEGYVTEKLLAAKAAGCVPLYWGDPTVARDFPGGYLDCNSFSSPDQLIEAVRSLDTDDTAWERLANTAAIHVDRERARLSTVARLILQHLVTPEELSKVPNRLGGSTTTEAVELGRLHGDMQTGAADKVAKPIPQSLIVPPLPDHGPKRATPLKEISWNGKTLLVTCATQRFLASLMKWLQTTQPRLSETVQGRVYLGEDVSDITTNMLRADFSDFTFLRLPTKSVTAPMFPDLWEPQHFAWKLWIYQQLVQEEALSNTLIWYMDAASVIVRWPDAWFEEVKRSGLCMLEDAEQQNNQWCHDMFCRRLMVTKEELDSQQIVGGIMAFLGGARLPWKLFVEAWILGQQADIIRGPKWAGVRPDGKPYGHRHDQSILSILRLRHKVPVQPLSTIYNHESLRRTFKSGACLYIHRGDYKETVDFAPRIGEAHLINLARRKDRVDQFKANHESWTKTVCLRPAFDGRRLNLTPALAALFRPNDFLWKKAIAGCALSHLSLWLELAQEDSCCENYLILEDDVKFRKGWMDLWKEAAKEIPDDYDVLYLGGVLPPNRGVFQNVLEQISPYWSRVKPNQVFGQQEPTRYFHFCNYAYILSRKGALKILEEIGRRGGYYTSADHMVCNRIEDMKHYVLTPLVAGCYQDDDPKYQQSVFNNFNRVDQFDSDLWNNDDRFSEIEIQEQLSKLQQGSPIALLDALRDALPTTLPEGLVAQSQAQPTKALDTSIRFATVGSHTLNPSALLEWSWLTTLLGEGLSSVQTLSLDHEPLSTEPIFIIMKPHLEEYYQTFQRYEAASRSFHVVHLSDEHGTDPISYLSLSTCKTVVRMYPRKDIAQNPKVVQIPLGPWRRTTETRDLKERQFVWNFVGTKWMGREGLLEPWKQINPHKAIFYESWMDKAQLSADEYSALCLSTMFMPCPRGQNVETFRFYEALEHGAIPIYIREPGDDDYYTLISSKLPLIPFVNWQQPLGFLHNLFQNQPMFEKYHIELMKAWATWKEALISEVRARLSL